MQEPDRRTSRAAGDAPAREGMLPAGAAHRLAVRVALVDPDDAVLLLRGHDPADPGRGWWWLLPGGGIDPGETEEQAAIREVREETGHRLTTVGEPVWRRWARFSFLGQDIVQDEHIYVVEVPAFEPVFSGWTEIERATLAETWRWWPPDELRVTRERVYPVGLGRHLEEWRRAGPPPRPRVIE